MMIELFHRFDKIYPLSEACKTHLQYVVQEHHVPPGHFLLKAGRVCRRMYFLQEGLVHGYQIIGDRQICTQLLKEGRRCYSPTSFSRQTPSRESLQAIGDCLLCSLDYEDIKNILRLFPEFVQILLGYTETDLAESEDRLEAFTTLNGYGLYQWLMKKRADFVQRFPGKYLASYIGLTPDKLGKIRRQYALQRE